MLFFENFDLQIPFDEFVVEVKGGRRIDVDLVEETGAGRRREQDRQSKKRSERRGFHV